ncbi:MAG: TPM domain-containing protein [Burkholderiales bacterium]|nr:TPM domain-containing protein [Burkholderiales bacterium]
MKKLVLLLVFLSSFLVAQVPKFENYINDLGNMLSTEEENQLNQFLKSYQDSTSNQIAILTLLNYDDRNEGPLFDFTMKVFQNWKIGQKSKNNGVLLIIVKNLATKNAAGLRIAVGYGLEGALPDARCSQIIENIRPLINEGKYFQGISTGIFSIISSIKGEFVNEEIKTKPSLSSHQKRIIIVVSITSVVVILFLIVLLNNKKSKRRNYYDRNDSNDQNENSFNTFFSSHSSGSSYSSDSFSSFSGGGDSSGGFDGGGGGDCGGGGAGD